MENIEDKRIVIRDTIERSKQCLEEGWRDSDFEFIHIEIEKNFYKLQDCLGWPSKEEINQKLTSLQQLYNNKEEGLRKANDYLLCIEREWINRTNLSGRK